MTIQICNKCYEPLKNQVETKTHTPVTECACVFCGVKDTGKLIVWTAPAYDVTALQKAMADLVMHDSYMADTILAAYRDARFKLWALQRAVSK